MGMGGFGGIDSLMRGIQSGSTNLSPEVILEVILMMESVSQLRYWSRQGQDRANYGITAHAESREKAVYGDG
jgi:hypothetical protein